MYFYTNTEVMASTTRENYIKALFYLHQKNEDISLSDLGAVLAVSKPTANDMIKKLQADGLVATAKYKPIRITNKGLRQAASIIRKHRLSEMFLMQIMNFGWEEVHDIAEELEHVPSEHFFDRMDEILGFPTVDPHGSPIPDKQGNYVKIEYKRLSQIAVGCRVVVKALRDSSMEFLLFLNKKSIKLQSQITVQQIETFDGSYSIALGDGEQVVLSKAVCDRLLVEEV